MLNSRARSARSDLPRINIELLEPRRLLSAHGFEMPPGFGPDGPGNSSGEGGVLVNFEHDSEHGNPHSSDNSSGDETFAPRDVAAFPVVIETVQEGPSRNDLQITLMETVIQLPLPPSSGVSDSWTGRPDVLQPTQPITSPDISNSDGSPSSGSTSTTSSSGSTSTGLTRGSHDWQDSLQIILIGDDGKEAQPLVILRGEFNLSGGNGQGLEKQYPPTLLPGDANSQHAQQAVTPAADTTSPVVAAPTPAPVAQAPAPSPPTLAPLPVVTPLALKPAGIAQTPVAATASIVPTAQVVTIAAPHGSVAALSATSETSAPPEAGHAAAHPLAALAAIAPGVTESQQLAGAVENVVQFATGQIQPAAAIIARAGELLANPMSKDSLPAAVAYNFIRFDAGTFHDAASIFAADLASMTGTTPDGVHSNTRAWIITGAVVGFDAVFLGYWYRKSIREKKAKAVSFSPAC
jgi:hypothetical protein